MHPITPEQSARLQQLFGVSPALDDGGFGLNLELLSRQSAPAPHPLEGLENGLLSR